MSKELDLDRIEATARAGASEVWLRAKLLALVVLVRTERAARVVLSAERDRWANAYAGALDRAEKAESAAESEARALNDLGRQIAELLGLEYKRPSVSLAALRAALSSDDDLDLNAIEARIRSDKPIDGPMVTASEALALIGMARIARARASGKSAQLVTYIIQEKPGVYVRAVGPRHDDVAWTCDPLAALRTPTEESARQFASSIQPSRLKPLQIVRVVADVAVEPLAEPEPDLFVSLSPEEYASLTPPTREQIRAALAKGRKELERARGRR